MRTLQTSARIPAPPAVAWDVLTDLDDHRSWNPFMSSISGAPEVGARLVVRLTPPGGRAMTVRPTVTAAEPGRRFEWLGHLGVPGLFDGRHRFELHDLGDGTTRLVHEEEFRGVLVPLLWRFVAGSTRAGFEQFDEAFARRVASLVADRD
jgi:hypothetical protein